MFDDQTITRTSKDWCDYCVVNPQGMRSCRSWEVAHLDSGSAGQVQASSYTSEPLEPLEPRLDNRRILEDGQGDGSPRRLWQQAR